MVQHLSANLELPESLEQAVDELLGEGYTLLEIEHELYELITANGIPWQTDRPKTVNVWAGVFRASRGDDIFQL